MSQKLLQRRLLCLPSSTKLSTWGHQVLQVLGCMPYSLCAYLRQKDQNFPHLLLYWQMLRGSNCNIVKLLHQSKTFVVGKFPGQDRREMANHFYWTCELKQILKDFFFLFMFFLYLYWGVADISLFFWLKFFWCSYMFVHKQRSEPVDDVIS